MIDHDVYIESIFFGMYRNWNLEPCLKVGGIVILADEVPGSLLSVFEEAKDRIRVHANEKVYTGVDEIKQYVSKYQDDELLKIRELEYYIGYRFTLNTKDEIRWACGSEAVWFLNNSIKIEEHRI